MLGKISHDILGGLVSVGASIGMHAAGLSSSLTSFLPRLLGQVVSSEAASTIFNGVLDNLSKFGHAITSAAGSAISFGAKVLEGVSSVTKAGFAKAVDFFSGIFDRQTQETLIQAGNGSIETAVLNNLKIENDAATFTIDGVTMNYDFEKAAFAYESNGVETSFKNLQITDSAKLISAETTIADNASSHNKYHLLPDGVVTMEVPLPITPDGTSVSAFLEFLLPDTIVNSTIAGPIGALPRLNSVSIDTLGLHIEIPKNMWPSFDPASFFSPGSLPTTKFKSNGQ